LTTLLAQWKVIGGRGNVNIVRAKVLLFEYSDNDYEHLDDYDINKEEKLIGNTNSKKRELVSQRR
jgi:hypothetical protein